MKNKGFTLIETLVAISILVLAVISATDIVRTGIFSYTYSKDKIVAFHLAQEGFEQIRNIRDKNNLEGNYWLDDMASSPSDPCFFGSACYVSVVESTIPTKCDGGVGSCPKLRQDPNEGFYGYDSGWTETKFTREITIERASFDEIAVTVKIDWMQGTISREFRARENLLDWQ